jgi:hypothetical protein
MGEVLSLGLESCPSLVQLSGWHFLSFFIIEHQELRFGQAWPQTNFAREVEAPVDTL